MSLVAACGGNDPSCADVSQHVGALFGPDAYGTEVQGAFLARCVDDKWSGEVRRCIASTKSLEDPKNCKAKLTADQAAALDKDLELAAKHEEGRVIPQSCLDLEVLVGAAMSCETIAKPERERIQKQFATAKAGWDKVENKSLLAPTCSAAITALKQATYECRPGAPK